MENCKGFKNLAERKFLVETLTIKKLKKILLFSEQRSGGKFRKFSIREIFEAQGPTTGFYIFTKATLLPGLHG